MSILFNLQKALFFEPNDFQCPYWIVSLPCPHTTLHACRHHLWMPSIVMQIQVLPSGFSQLPCRIFFCPIYWITLQSIFFCHSEILLAGQHYVLVNNVKIIMKIPRNCTWVSAQLQTKAIAYCTYLTTHKYSGNIYSVVRRNLNKEYVQRVKEQESRDQPKSHLSKTG